MLKIAGIVEDSITDGPGLRTTIFFQGCDKNCMGCHNPEAIPLVGGKEFSSGEIFDIIDDNILIQGVTFSGGEPLLQAKEIIPLAEKINKKNLNLIIYTGDVFEDILKTKDKAKLKLLELADCLIDGPFILEQRDLSLSFRGSKNQRILDLKKSLEKREAVLIEL
ncbi:MAG: anaerobic ribonucleoside-triphosphate reductase activating protein [Clostridiales Family XIII bacterium]|jgi:anaerobic ribonucleoside-triphosphate reductase activating protein|nr:anaerobic ribonucleoside-triphosphate reductase activating protein [Clostridiales Family XIII bacterium]